MTNSNRILLVEPEGIAQNAEATFLKHWGAEVDIASNGNSALDKAQTSIYDFILVDAYLEARFNGFEVVNAIKNYSINKKTQCAILDYDITHENMAKAGRLRVWFFLKPISLADAKDILALAKE